RTIANLHLRDTPKTVLGRMNVSSVPDSAVLQVSHDDRSAASATRTLQELASVFTTLVRQKLGKAPVADQTTLPRITATVFDPAHASATPVSPRPTRTLALAGFVGLALGLILGLLRDA